METPFLRLTGINMNNFTAKDEQAFLNACAILDVEPKVMMDGLKKRYVVSGFLKDPLVWLETELRDRTYTTRGEAQEAADCVDRFINEGGNNGSAKQGWSTKAFKGDIGYSVRLEVGQTRN
jgi:hypothetical protein